MPYVGAADPKNYVFGDIRRVIGYALEVARKKQGVESGAMSRHAVGHGEAGGFEDLAVHVVDEVVALKHGVGEIGVRGQERVQSVAHHLDRQRSHAGNVDVEWRFGIVHHVHHALDDVHRLVPDALQVGIDLDAGDDEAQVDGHGLLHGQKINRELIYLTLRGVDLRLVAQHQLANRDVAVLEGANRTLHSLFGQSTHPQKLLLELVESLMKPGTRHPNLPRMSP